ILMDAVKAGGDRQELHEKIRVLSMEAGMVVKNEGKPNDLLERIAADKSFGLSAESLKNTVKAENYVGIAPLQVEMFLKDYIDPLLEANKDLLGMKAGEIKV
ncbi:MAG: adenylosuccinate lyase, partial [Firmicutes bacterium]|nr:adenylosuccinate lyase [Bacillota bacterium]